MADVLDSLRELMRDSALSEEAREVVEGMIEEASASRSSEEIFSPTSIRKEWEAFDERVRAIEDGTALRLVRQMGHLDDLGPTEREVVKVAVRAAERRLESERGMRGRRCDGWCPEWIAVPSPSPTDEPDEPAAKRTRTDPSDVANAGRSRMVSCLDTTSDPRTTAWFRLVQTHLSRGQTAPKECDIPRLFAFTLVKQLERQVSRRKQRFGEMGGWQKAATYACPRCARVGSMTVCALGVGSTC